MYNFRRPVHREAGILAAAHPRIGTLGKEAGSLGWGCTRAKVLREDHLPEQNLGMSEKRARGSILGSRSAAEHLRTE